MKKFTKLTIITLLMALTSIGLSFAPVFAECSDVCDASCEVPQSVKDSAGCSTPTNTLPSTIQKILNAIILVSGTIAVVFIIVGGVQYMTSAGDPGKLKKAKDTILYACIGLLICVLSFAIVNFVIIKLIGSGK